MIGILVALAISWGLLHLLAKKNLLALGLLPLPKRLKQFSIGFFITGSLCVCDQLLERSLTASTWVLNEQSSLETVLSSFWWDVKSVLTEELIFRGALLYILMQHISSQKSILISAIAFGIYHWFSYGVLGNPMAMLFVFIGTGFMGYAWAWAFAKTRSIWLPFGLHLGWNFVYNTIFSNGPLGDMLVLSKGGQPLTDWISLLNFLSGLLIVPLIVLLYVKYFVKEESIANSNITRINNQNR